MNIRWTTLVDAEIVNMANTVIWLDIIHSFYGLVFIISHWITYEEVAPFTSHTLGLLMFSFSSIRKKSLILQLGFLWGVTSLLPQKLNGRWAKCHLRNRPPCHFIPPSPSAACDFLFFRWAKFPLNGTCSWSFSLSSPPPRSYLVSIAPA